VLNLNLTPFPVLETSRLQLRKVTAGDAPRIFFLRSDARVMAFLDRAPAACEEEAVQFIQNINKLEQSGDAVNWALALKEDTTLIGTIGYWRMQKEHYRAEIGYTLHPDNQGKGLMQEALTAVLQYGFQVMNLHSVEANVNPANAASIKLLERAGFVREGYFRENYFYNGRFLDSAIYSLLAPMKNEPDA
jgi:ribosomal-protein-alanine N-acetyltransferase